MKMDNGLFGIGSWCRGINGKRSYQTSGDGPTGCEVLGVQHEIKDPKLDSSKDLERHEAAAKKAYGFWIHSSETGESDYLKRKGVGYYGIRFRSNEYGNVAVIPMRDIDGNLWSYQLLNPNGTKRCAKGAPCDLFHALGPIEKEEVIGIAESYVTAATCMELTGITCVSCFGCNNLKGVVASILSRYSNKRIVIFADDDRHGDRNEGLLKAQAAQKLDESRVVLAVPDFVDCGPYKEASDWNDLVRLLGRDAAKSQLSTLLANLASNP
jgi:putative DNA primase/helicase